ncbi:MAG: GNAT family N-acetyltransferase [Bacteroidales bacterium]|nr:GNAT family N-acetyltransferase [Bacteroidales bacterium]
MKIKIREANESDLDFLLCLEKESFEEFQQNSKKSIQYGIKSKFQEIFITEIASKRNSAIGSFVLFKYPKSLRIYSIALLKDFQSKGIGNQMLDFIKARALKNGYLKIILEVDAGNSDLTEWYQSRGFQITGYKKDYYRPGKHALTMEFNVVISKEEEINNIIVINKPFKWDYPINAKVISVKEYINNPVYQNTSDFRIFNLCSSYKYQSYGYYVSLLASARGQRVIPNITTIRDFKINHVIQSAANDIDRLINNLLNKNTSNVFSLNIYFGQTTDKKYEVLAMKLYQLFEAPLFKVEFIKHDSWLIKSINTLTLSSIPESEKELLYQLASNYFNRKRYNFAKLINYKYDLAVLVNPKEKNPPSNQEALQKIKNVGNKKGVYVEFITKEDADKINEFDALFIRETTNVNHHTYELSRLAYAEGLVVIDDPWSILRCSNKIYQNELFRKHKILTPNTVALTKNFSRKKMLDQFQYPMILKQPDSAFSLGVKKVENKEEAETELMKLFKKSDMVICQEFLYSEFDWRIGVLDNKPLFACKYFMSKNHWQIYDWNSDDEEKSGDAETLPIQNVPENIIKTAVKASSLIGDGLYGVDLKLVDGKVYVVEVNDNPNIDFGVEDMISKDALYEQLIDSFINRIETARNISKINFINK